MIAASCRMLCKPYFLFDIPTYAVKFMRSECRLVVSTDDLLTPVHSLTLKIDGNVELEAGKDNRYIISKLAFDSDQAKTPDDPAIPLRIAESDSIDKSDETVLRASEDLSTTTRKPYFGDQETVDINFGFVRRQEQQLDTANSRYATIFTTKYEKGTTNGVKSNAVFRSHTAKKNKKKKKKGKRNKPSPKSEEKSDSNEEEEHKKLDKHKKKKHARVGPKQEYVYIYFKNDTDGNRQKIIMYNKTHYAYYPKELPAKFYNVYNLWSDLHEPAKVFDDEFKPPWWMEFHKPPYWMQYHDKEKKGKETWDIFHEFHSTYPTPEEDEPTTEAMPLPFEPEYELQKEPNLEAFVSNSQAKISKWIGSLWEKLKKESIQEKDGKKIINLSFALPLWYRQHPEFSRKDGKAIEGNNEYFAKHTTRLQGVTQNIIEHNEDDAMQLLFNELKKTVEHQKIKTKMDYKLYESIISSNSMVLKLLNMMVNEINKRAKANSHEIIESIKINQENKTYMNWQLDQVCEKLGICKSSSEFIQYIMDILNFAIGLKEDKFKIVFKNVMEIVKKLNLSSILNDNAITSIQKTIQLMEKETVLMQKTKVIILKNIIWTNKLVESLPGLKKNVSGKIRNAFIRIIDKLDEKIVASDNNRKQWYTIKNDLHSWEKDVVASKRIDQIIQDFMMNFITILSKLDQNTVQDLLENFKIMLE